jgi:(S)-2-hydroxyglutarate dehydrogenase
MALDYLIVGGGIVGLATAYLLQQTYPGARIRLLEKEARVALHQSGRNSGVVHAGVYYEPGSLKARLCRAGLRATREFAAVHGIPYTACGKVIVATSSLETARLRELMTRAERNGVQHRWLESAALRELEPNVRGEAGLLISESGMIDYAAVAARLVALSMDTGIEFAMNAEVLAIREAADHIEVDTSNQTHRARCLIVCAGLYGDRLARLAGLELDFLLVPFRGDYFRLAPSRQHLVAHHIYPVPDPSLPFLGVHLTRLIDGGISVGPSAMLALHREGYHKTQLSLGDTWEMVRYPGVWRLLRRHARTGLNELAAAISTRRYLRLVQKYCPDLTLADLIPHPSGVRAQAVTRDGRLVHDFLLKRTKRALYVCNAPSPAATAAFPIAREILRQVQEMVQAN